MILNINKNDAVTDKGVKTVKSYLYRQALASIASSTVTICSGITMGITAVMLPQLREEKNIQYNASYDSWIASSATLAMVIGSMGSGPILDSFGRKAAHIIQGVLGILGWIIIACANSIDLIIVGRVITGLATGANRAISLVYIGEITDPKYRTVCLFLPGLLTHIGNLFSHIVGHFLTWKLSAVACLVPAILSCISVLFVKESPFWLIAKGRTQEGIEAFRWFRGTDEASESELKIVLQRQSGKHNISAKETFNAVCSMYFIKPMLLLLVLMVNVQFSGVNVFVFYSQDILERTFSQSIDAFVLMIVIDSIRATIDFFICLLGNLVPKKMGFLISTFAVSVFVIGLVTGFMMKIESIWLPGSCLFMYIAFSSAVVTIGWTFVPELLPSNARGLGSGINSTMSYLLLFFIVKITPDFINEYGASAFYGFFGVSTLVTGLILIFFLPETHGKTLQSIEDSFNQKNIVQIPL